MAYVSKNLVDLEQAQRQSKIVRFVYRTKSDDRLVARIGTVAELSNSHVLVNDVFHGGAPRACILDRIESAVEF